MVNAASVRLSKSVAGTREATATTAATAAAPKIDRSLELDDAAAYTAIGVAPSATPTAAPRRATA